MRKEIIYIFAAACVIFSCASARAASDDAPVAEAATKAQARFFPLPSRVSISAKQRLLRVSGISKRDDFPASTRAQSASSNVDLEAHKLMLYVYDEVR